MVWTCDDERSHIKTNNVSDQSIYPPINEATSKINYLNTLCIKYTQLLCVSVCVGVYLMLSYSFQLCRPADWQHPTAQLSWTINSHFPVLLLSSPQLFVSSSSFTSNMTIQMGGCHPTLTHKHTPNLKNVCVCVYSSESFFYFLVCIKKIQEGSSVNKAAIVLLPVETRRKKKLMQQTSLFKEMLSGIFHTWQDRMFCRNQFRGQQYCRGRERLQENGQIGWS